MYRSQSQLELNIASAMPEPKTADMVHSLGRTLTQ